MIIAAGLCMGCAGLAHQRAGDLSAHVPLGLVTVVSNYNIYWADEDPKAAEWPKREDNPEKTRFATAEGLITEAEAIVRQSFAKAGITAQAPKDRITGSRAYAAAKRQPGWNNKNTVIAGGGYAPINYRDRQFARALAEETGVKGGIYIVFDFAKAMVTGIGKTGTFRAQLHMKVIIVDEAGRVLYNKDRVAASDEKIRVSLRNFNRDELLDLFRFTIADACALFIKDFAAANSLNLENSGL
jgi:hypothetical protein